MRAVVDHLDTLLAQRFECGSQARQAVGDAGVVLDVGVPVEILRGLFGALALHHVDQEALHDLAVCFGAVKVGRRDGTVDLCAAGRVGLGDGGQVVPVLADLAVGVKAEDVERDLLARAGEVVHRVQKHLVTVFKGADVAHCGGDGGAC